MFNQNLYTSQKINDKKNGEKLYKIRITASEERHQRLTNYGDCDIYIHLTTQQTTINSKVYDEVEKILEFMEGRKRKGRKKDRLFKISINTAKNGDSNDSNAIFLHIRRIDKTNMSIDFIINLLKSILDFFEQDLGVYKDEYEDDNGDNSVENNFLDDFGEEKETEYEGHVQHNLKVDDEDDGSDDYHHSQTKNDYQSQYVDNNNDYSKDEEAVFDDYLNDEANENSNIVPTNMYASVDNDEKESESNSSYSSNNNIVSIDDYFDKEEVPSSLNEDEFNNEVKENQFSTHEQLNDLRDINKRIGQEKSNLDLNSSINIEDVEDDILIPDESPEESVSSLNYHDNSINNEDKEKDSGESEEDKKKKEQDNKLKGKVDDDGFFFEDDQFFT